MIRVELTPPKPQEHVEKDEKPRQQCSGGYAFGRGETGGECAKAFTERNHGGDVAGDC